MNREGGHIFGKTVEHTEANLVDLIGGSFRTEPLRFRCEDDAVGDPVITLFASPL